MTPALPDADQRIVERFRATGGQVGAPFENDRVLLLTTTDATTGDTRTTPLTYLLDGGPRTLIVASNGGAPDHPAWFHDLLAEPYAVVENGVFTFRSRATVLEGDEREKVYARAAEADPRLADERASTTRPIPIVALSPISGAPNGDTWSGSLGIIHNAFRRELALIRKEIAASGPRLGAQLRINCLTMCQGLHHHHASEDSGMFPVVDEHHPELAPAMEQLRAEHARLAQLLDELQALIQSDNADLALVRSEVERLTSEVEAHLDHEEEYLFPILDALAPASS